jgi:hypothetical protein
MDGVMCPGRTANISYLACAISGIVTVEGCVFHDNTDQFRHNATFLDLNAIFIVRACQLNSPLGGGRGDRFAKADCQAVSSDRLSIESDGAPAASLSSRTRHHAIARAISRLLPAVAGLSNDPTVSDSPPPRRGGCPSSASLSLSATQSYSRSPTGSHSPTATGSLAFAVSQLFLQSSRRRASLRLNSFVLRKSPSTRVSSDLPQSRPFFQSTVLSSSKLPDPSPPSLDSPGSAAAGWIRQIATAGIRIGSIMILTVVHR